jgi:hypothetical protein
VGRKKVALSGGVTVSATRREKETAAAARARAGLAGLGPRRGNGERPTRGEASGRGDGGLRAKDGLLGFTGQKPGRRMKFLFFFLFKYFKHFQMILNPILNLNQTTQYKNSNATSCVHKHVSTLIFDFKLIKIIIILNLYAHQIAL